MVTESRLRSPEWCNSRAPHAGLASLVGASQTTGFDWRCYRWAGRIVRKTHFFGFQRLTLHDGSADGDLIPGLARHSLQQLI